MKFINLNLEYLSSETDKHLISSEKKTRTWLITPSMRTKQH